LDNVLTEAVVLEKLPLLIGINQGGSVMLPAGLVDFARRLFLTASVNKK